MRRRWTALREQLRSGFWAVPSLCVVLAVLLSLLMVEVDRRLQTTLAYTFGAGPSGAREVLGAITTAMITFTGLVFSITVLVLQLTSSQFSPRVLRTFLRDRLTQWSLGVFTSTFVYSVLVLRTVRSDEEGQEIFVPGLSTTVALVLLLVSVALFVAYIHHISNAIQVSSIIAEIGKETRAALERRYPSGRASTGAPARPPIELPSLVLPARSTGVVVSVDEQGLVALARRADVVLRSATSLGDHLPQGAPMIEVLGDPAGLDVQAVVEAVEQDRERRLEDDVAFGFRQLVDIATRALSPGVNDPTTAVQAVDQLHDLLRRLATRPLRSGIYCDDLGRVRLVLPAETLGDYLQLALEEVTQYGSDAVQVTRRIDRLLDDVTAAALPEHRSSLAEAVATYCT